MLWYVMCRLNSLRYSYDIYIFKFEVELYGGFRSLVHGIFVSRFASHTPPRSWCATPACFKLEHWPSHPIQYKVLHGCVLIKPRTFSHTTNACFLNQSLTFLILRVLSVWYHSNIVPVQNKCYSPSMKPRTAVPYETCYTLLLIFILLQSYQTLAL